MIAYQLIVIYVWFQLQVTLSCYIGARNCLLHVYIWCWSTHQQFTSHTQTLFQCSPMRIHIRKQSLSDCQVYKTHLVCNKLSLNAFQMTESYWLHAILNCGMAIQVHVLFPMNKVTDTRTRYMTLFNFCHHKRYQLCIWILRQGYVPCIMTEPIHCLCARMTGY